MGRADERMLEAYTTLGFLAGQTQRIDLGAMVTAAPYRAPGLLIKQISTLDVLSGGRAWLGVGAGWYERESRGLGVPFPRVGERFERLREKLEIAHRMWAADLSPYYGKHFQLAEPLCSPLPIS